jgi:hypothetical protein
MEVAIFAGGSLSILALTRDQSGMELVVVGDVLVIILMCHW